MLRRKGHGFDNLPRGRPILLRQNCQPLSSVREMRDVSDHRFKKGLFSAVCRIQRSKPAARILRLHFIPGAEGRLAGCDACLLGQFTGPRESFLGIGPGISAADVRITSIGHLFGPQRFDTGEGSRNNFVLGYLAMGDGWHNNHHRAPSSARHGFAWYELDLSYQFIRFLKVVGLAWDIKQPPPGLMPGTAKPEAVAAEDPAPATLP